MTNLDSIKKEAREEFAKKFTDKIDAENNYYDAQFVNKPYYVWDFLDSLISRAHSLGRQEALEEANDNAYARWLCFNCGFNVRIESNDLEEISRMQEVIQDSHLCRSLRTDD